MSASESHKSIISRNQTTHSPRPGDGGSRIHGYIICTHQTYTTLSGRRNVRSAVPYPASVPLHATNRRLVEGHYGESRSLCKATILPAGGGAEELPRPVTRQRHKRHAALDRVSVTPLHELTSSRADSSSKTNNDHHGGSIISAGQHGGGVGTISCASVSTIPFKFDA